MSVVRVSARIHRIVFDFERNVARGIPHDEAINAIGDSAPTCVHDPDAHAQWAGVLFDGAADLLANGEVLDLFRPVSHWTNEYGELR
jgi:hypothetical protein